MSVAEASAAVVEPWPLPRSRRATARLGGIGWLGLALLAAVVLAATLGGVLAPYGVHALAGEPLEAPSGAHLLGTNSIGQDVLSQLLAGARSSLLVALVAGGGSLALGALVGIVAGWLGGIVEALLMRIVDILLTIPRLPLLIVVGAYAGSSLWTVAAIIAATSWMAGARILRGQVLSLRSRAHLLAAAGFGAGVLYMLRRHLVPELALILVAGFVAAAERAVMLEAGLAFLGLGDPTRKSWGSMMRDALGFSSLFLTNAWEWWLVPPVAALAVFLLALTFVGVALEDRINPRLRRHAAGGRP